jgi:hypothetical protein
MPVFLSRAWLWVDYVPTERLLKLKVTRSFGEPVAIRFVASEAGAKSRRLDRPFIMKEGESLDLSNELDQLTSQAPAGWPDTGRDSFDARLGPPAPPATQRSQH